MAIINILFVMIQMYELNKQPQHNHCTSGQQQRLGEPLVLSQAQNVRLRVAMPSTKPDHNNTTCQNRQLNVCSRGNWV